MSSKTVSKSLCAELGGKPVIESVVHDFYQMVYYDHQLKAYFETTDMDALRAHQTEFLSMVTGGPTDYSGRDMERAHAELDITTQDFELVVSYLERALEQNDISEAHRETILSAVEAYEDAIVSQ